MAPARRIVWGLAGALLLFAAASGEVPDRARAAALRLASSFDPAQREAGVYAFDDPERFDLRLAPFGLDGVRVAELDAEQRELLWSLLEPALSPSGLQKIRTIMSLEAEVARLDAARAFGLGRALSWLIDRDPEAYYLTLYGALERPGPWGYRFDGHHVSLNTSFVPDRPTASTPLFLGGQPRRVREGWERAGLQVLADEENLARALYTGLPEVQRAAATLPFAADRALFLGEGPRLELRAPAVGLPAGELSPSGSRQLDQLLEAYLGLWAPELASHQRERIRAQREAIHFAWAGSAVPGEPHYYRLHGPRLLIEFDNSGDDADHIHLLWRDPEADYGLDLLAQHHARVAHASAPPERR